MQACKCDLHRADNLQSSDISAKDRIDIRTPGRSSMHVCRVSIKIVTDRHSIAAEPIGAALKSPDHWDLTRMPAWSRVRMALGTPSCRRSSTAVAPTRCSLHSSFCAAASTLASRSCSAMLAAWNSLAQDCFSTPSCQKLGVRVRVIHCRPSGKYPCKWICPSRHQLPRPPHQR